MFMYQKYLHRKLAVNIPKIPKIYQINAANIRTLKLLLARTFNITRYKTSLNRKTDVAINYEMLQRNMIAELPTSIKY